MQVTRGAMGITQSRFSLAELVTCTRSQDDWRSVLQNGQSVMCWISADKRWHPASIVSQWGDDIQVAIEGLHEQRRFDRRDIDLQPAMKDRAMTLAQLKRFADECRAECKSGKVLDPRRFLDKAQTVLNPGYDQRLNFDEAPSWLVVDLFVKPKTAQRVPFVDTLATRWPDLGGPRTTTHFVSHSWEQNFIKDLEGLASFGDRACFWICCFATTQDEERLEALNGAEMFKEALVAPSTKAHVVMLDDTGETLTRMWVLFEILRATENRKRIIFSPAKSHLVNCRVETAAAHCANTADERYIRGEFARLGLRKVVATIREAIVTAIQAHAKVGLVPCDARESPLLWDARKSYKEGKDGQHRDTLISQKILDSTFAVARRHPEAKSNEIPESETLSYQGCHYEAERIAETLIDPGLHDRAERLMREKCTSWIRQWLESVRETVGEKHPETLRFVGNLAATLSALGRYEEAEPLKRQWLEFSREVLGERHPETLTVLESLAATLSALGRYDEAEPLTRARLELSREVLGEQHPETLRVLGSLAETLSALGRHDEAEPLKRKWLKFSREVLGERHPETLKVLKSLAATLSALGRYDEAEPLIRARLELSKEVLGEQHPETLRVLGSLAETLSALRRHHEAEPLKRKWLELAREVLGEKHPETLRVLGSLAATLSALGRYDEAELLTRKWLEFSREVLGERHPETLTVLKSLAATLSALGRHDEAGPLGREALQLSREVFGKTDPETLKVLKSIAAMLSDQRRHGEAELLQRERLDISMKTLGERHAETIEAMGSLAATLAAQGRNDEAEPLEKQVLELSRQVHGERHQATLRALGNLAATLSAQGRHVEAENLKLQRLSMSTELLGEDHPDTVVALSNYAATLKDQGRLAEAEPLCRQVYELRCQVLGKLHPATQRSKYVLEAFAKEHNI